MPGNVGIGSVNPIAKLDVVGGGITIDNTQFTRLSFGNITSRSVLGYNSSNVLEVGQITGGGPLAFVCRNLRIYAR